MNGYDIQTLTTSAEMAAVAEFAYLDASGVPRIEPVTPLLLDGVPAFTLTYARSEEAREISASSQAALVFSDSRLAYVGWSPLTATVRTEVIQDPEGELFSEKLLDQELQKFPPDRQLIDSPLLRRENWWYVPRFIIRLVGTGEPRPVARRETLDHGVLAYVSGGGLTAETVRIEGWNADRIPIRLPGSGEPSLPEGSPATLLYHDFAVPDMDPRTSFLAAGRLENGRLSVTRRSGSRTLDERPGLLARWRAQRDLKRRCEAGLNNQL